MQQRHLLSKPTHFICCTVHCPSLAVPLSSIRRQYNSTERSTCQVFLFLESHLSSLFFLFFVSFLSPPLLFPHLTYLFFWLLLSQWYFSLFLPALCSLIDFDPEYMMIGHWWILKNQSWGLNVTFCSHDADFWWSVRVPMHPIKPPLISCHGKVLENNYLPKCSRAQKAVLNKRYNVR